ncbi:hypothetical protein [Saccharopolyspora sp. 5N708]
MASLAGKLRKESAQALGVGGPASQARALAETVLDAAMRPS